MQGEVGMSVWVWALGALVLVGAVAWWLRGRAQRVDHGGAPVAFPGSAAPAVPRDYNPKNVGNDSAARPWEQSGLPFDAAEPQEPTFDAGLNGATNLAAGWPAGFDPAAFLVTSKANFIRLQAAWDRADIATLRGMMTADMIAQIQVQLADRERQAVAAPASTEVAMLEARLLGMEESPSAYLASVEFSGLIRDEASAGPNPFREVWAITHPKTGGGAWLVAGVQALQ